MCLTQRKRVCRARKVVNRLYVKHIVNVTLAHEIGHTLNMSHTMELDKTRWFTGIMDYSTPNYRDEIQFAQDFHDQEVCGYVSTINFVYVVSLMVCF